jgi:ParB family chromosome partitioning protein
LQTESVTRQVRLVDISEPGHRLRETIDPERLGALADSIAAEGLHQPVGVRGPMASGSFEIIWGHRRFLAHRLLGRETIEAKVFAADYDPLLAATSENLNREQLNPIEEARAVARFVERGEPDAAIARLFRRSAAWVSQRRALLTMPEDIQAAVQRDELPLGVASALADVDEPNYRAQLIAEAARTGATVRTADVWRAHYLADRDRIIQNHYTIQQIVERREAWVVKIACDLCQVEEAYQDTRSVRCCVRCFNQLAEAVREAQREAAEAVPRSL